MDQHEYGPQTASRHLNDQLANERTLLAWIRSGIAIIGLGFVISRFGLLLREQAQPALPSNAFHFSSLFGLALVATGILAFLMALFQFLHIRRSLGADQLPLWRIPGVVLMVLLSGISTLLFVYLLFVG